jgi:hypothetical protein
MVARDTKETLVASGGSLDSGGRFVLVGLAVKLFSRNLISSLLTVTISIDNS